MIEAPETAEGEVATNLLNHKLECPFCHQRLEVFVVSRIKDLHVHTGSSSFHKTNAVVNATMQPLRTVIKHVCEIKEED